MFRSELNGEMNFFDVSNEFEVYSGNFSFMLRDKRKKVNQEL
jgi:hypothetical protein